MRPSSSRPRRTAGSGAAQQRSLPALLALLLGCAARCASAAACYRSLSRADFPHCSLLSPSFALHWRVAGTEEITLGLDADTGGYPDAWLGVALSEAGGMRGADIMVVAAPPGGAGTAAAAGSNRSGGGWRTIDAHAVDFVTPIRDEQQDLTLVGTPLSGPNHTVAVIRRRLRTCDPWDRHIQVGVPQTVSWAFGRRWPRQHLNKGNAAVFFVPEADSLWGVNNATAAANATTNPTPRSQPLTSLFAATPTAATPLVKAFSAKASGGDGDDAHEAASFPDLAALDPSDPDLRLLQLRMPNVSVPANTTTSYICAHTTLPSDRKYHIVGSRAIVQSPLIHHMILFACERPPPQQLAKMRSRPPGQVGPELFDCQSTGGGEGCNTFYISWAPGSEGGPLPPTVGMPVGELDSTYFSLQVHYNNPEAVAGVVDDSGFTLSLTPRLRTYDAGVLTVGQSAIAIPPGLPSFTLQPNVCPSACTAQLDTPLRLLGSGLHAHTLGRSIVTQHIRNGIELPPVGNRRFYDFNFQGRDPVPLDSSILAPGDSLITTCTYDSTERKNVTRFGESTQDEMCFNFILYYPKAPHFTYCASMDAVGDPGVALCGGMNETAAVGGVVAGLVRNATATAANATGAKAAAAVLRPPPQQQQRPRVNLTSVPALAGFFRSGALSRVAANDSGGYVPYGTECPDMGYGLPAEEARRLVLQALSDG